MLSHGWSLPWSGPGGDLTPILPLGEGPRQRYDARVQIKSHPNRFFLIAFVLLALIGMFVWRLMLPGPRLFAWAFGANVSAFAIWFFDKHQSRTDGWRVPERTLHTMAVLGASPASLCAMSILRHKTQKRFFTGLYSGLLVVHIALLLLIFFPPS